MTEKNRYPFIVSPEVRSIYRKFDMLRRVPYVSEGNLNLLLTGESGLGKSELLKRYERRNFRVDEGFRTRVPVLYVNIRSPKTMKAFLSEILISLGDPQNGVAKDSRTALKTLSMLCSTCGVELILLDEAQTLMQNRSLGVLATIADWVRDLADAVGVPIVLTGMPWCEGFVDSYEQISTRFGYRHRLDDYMVSKRFNRYVTFTGKYLAALSEDNKVDVSDKDFAFRMFSHTSGRLRATTGLLNVAHELSKEAGRPLNKQYVIGAAVLQKGDMNSFTESIGKITLQEVVSPSQWVNQKGYSRERHIPPVYDTYKVNNDYTLVRQ
ncbi:TniB family NTP-binding protein [Gilvimarinus algae]|uniref:TniB family NTP-binding protein n=1 Tax=Gilvimarinus algae TaxID=3058037 RepID=A0ABT8T9W5_9GAMM|nr:TniB family NTP-binding protein [Gilvimarinus sp. SDUM040014]MDO3380897.1 TniB family NTP-binding protein [Gilvimarinus sp. SDUM040014]